MPYPRGRKTIRFGRYLVNATEMGREIGMNANSLTYILHGKRQPSLGRAMRIAEALNITLDMFYKTLSAQTAKVTKAPIRKKIRAVA